MRELLRGSSTDVQEERMLLPPQLRLAVGLTLIIVAWGFLLASESGLQMRDLTSVGTPMKFVTLDPARRLELHSVTHEAEGEEHEEAEIERYPGIIVAHGFAGSSALMQAYAHVLARAGFGVLLIDFPGHGDNSAPMAEGSLVGTLERAREALVDQPEIDPSRIGLLGHSMGAKAVIDASFRDPEMAGATVAISPVGTEVGERAPRNLQLQAGAWEQRFLQAARNLLRRAGGPSSALSAGEARELVVVPWAEHLSILFRDASHVAARDWFEGALGDQELAATGFRDRRIVWWLVYVTGFLMLTISLAPVRWQPSIVPRGGSWPRLLAFVAAPFAATLALVLVSRVFPLHALGGMAVGPALALWLFIAGSIFLLVPYRVDPPGGRHLLWGVGMFVILWLALGATSDFVWLSWGLEGDRLWLWPLFGIACTPWLVGMEALRTGARGGRRLAWWVLESILVCAGVWVLARLVPGLDVLALALPVLVFFLGCLSVIAGRVNDAWASGIGGGLFLGWLLAAVFPLVG